MPDRKITSFRRVPPAISSEQGLTSHNSTRPSSDYPSNRGRALQTVVMANCYKECLVRRRLEIHAPNCIVTKSEKEVNLETLQRLKVGIDIGRDKANYAFLHPEGHPLEIHRSFSNSPMGKKQAKQLLIKTLEKHHFSGVDIAVEATGYYWLPLYIQLQQDRDLTRFEPRLSVLNAGWVKWYKKSFPLTINRTNVTHFT